MENICDACGGPIDGPELVGVVIRGGRKDGGSWTLMLCDRCSPRPSQADETTPQSFDERLADALAAAIGEAQEAGYELTIDEVRGIASRTLGSA